MKNWLRRQFGFGDTGQPDNTHLSNHPSGQSGETSLERLNRYMRNCHDYSLTPGKRLLDAVETLTYIDSEEQERKTIIKTHLDNLDLLDSEAADNRVREALKTIKVKGEEIINNITNNINVIKEDARVHHKEIYQIIKAIDYALEQKKLALGDRGSDQERAITKLEKIARRFERKGLLMTAQKEIEYLWEQRESDSQGIWDENKIKNITKEFIYVRKLLDKNGRKIK